MSVHPFGVDVPLNFESSSSYLCSQLKFRIATFCLAFYRVVSGKQTDQASPLFHKLCRAIGHSSATPFFGQDPITSILADLFGECPITSISGP